MEARQSANSLWQRRASLPQLPLSGALILTALLWGLCALSTRVVWFLLPGWIVGGVITAALCLLSRTPLALLAPAGAAVCAALAAPHAALTAAALLGVPMGAAAAASVFLSENRMRTAVAAACAGGACAAVCAAILLAASDASFAQTIERLRLAFIENLCAVTVATKDGAVQLLSEESAAALWKYLLSLTPALSLGGLFLLGAAQCALLCAFLSLLGAAPAFFGGPWPLEAGRAAAVCFFAARLLAFLFSMSRQAETVYYALYNLSLVLMWPLALDALGVGLARLRRSERFGAFTRLAVVCLAVMIASASMYWFFTAAAFAGTVIVFRRARTRSDLP